MPAAEPAPTVGGLQSMVLRWAECRRRDLPWRNRRDGWSILVSEIMLQQTPVERVVPVYERFMARFSSPGACAAASPGEVITAWSGLGYNRRAVYLHATAQRVVSEHGGRVPVDLTDLLALPGVGPYTARAVLVFAGEEDVGVVDTNVGRMLARWTGEPLGATAAQRLADELVPPGCGWAWNQALFDLAAAFCTKRSPRCEHCPVRSVCRWRGSGTDPATSSAGVPVAQSRFAGSDRQGRGRLVAALRRGPLTRTGLAPAAGWPDEPGRAALVAASLVADGLAEWHRDVLRLPSAGVSGADR